MLMRIADRAFAGSRRAKGVIESRAKRIGEANGSGKLGLTGKSVTHRVAGTLGTPRFLHGDESSARDPDLFGIGAEQRAS